MNLILTPNLSILIIDDNESKTNQIQSHLIDIAPNCSISIAKDRISSLKILQTEKFDLLLLDMNLPNRFGESEADANCGMDILEELDSSDDYIQPTRIIAFTEFENLQVKLRDRFSEIGAIKFSPSSNDWKSSIERILKSLIKAKQANKKIIYCEGQNASFYNLIGFSNIEFWSLKDSRAVYFAAKNESDRYALRDRDFLTTNEIKTLTNKPYFENYAILEYYCFENYLYHPANLKEASTNFDSLCYTDEIIRQKNQKLESIIQDYKLSRLGYTDFLDNEKKTMDPTPEDEIIKSLKSDDFEVFYRFFDMAGKNDKGLKKSFNKTILSEHRFEATELVKTKWFKEQMTSVLQKILKVN